MKRRKRLEIAAECRRLATTHGNPSDPAKYNSKDNKSRQLLIAAEALESPWWKRS